MHSVTTKYDMKEKELVELLQKKDCRAYNLVYDKYAPALYGLICKWIDDRKLADEVLRKSFIAIWQQSDRLKNTPSGAFMWMHNVARNVAMEEINRKIRLDKFTPCKTNLQRISALGLSSIFLS